MALYHLAIKAVSRSAGRNAVQAAAYRAGERLVCERTGSVFNYERRHGVVATRIVVPQGETSIERARLWNAAEAAERRCNSTVAREIEVALPHDLAPSERQVLAFAFAQQMAERYGVVVDVAIHEPSPRGDQRNYHAHVLMTTRVLKPDGSIGEKVRRLDDLKTGPLEVSAIRRLWESGCNDALAAAGVTATVDHRSHADRGLASAPGRKLGVGAVGYEQRTGMASRRRLDHEADAVALEVAGRQVAQQDKIAHTADPHRQRDGATAAMKTFWEQFAAAMTRGTGGGHGPAVEVILLTHAVGRPVSTGVSAASLSRQQPSSGLMGSASQLNAPKEKRVSDQAWQPDREEEDAAAMHRRVARALEAEHLAQLSRQNAEAERLVNQPRRAVAWPFPSQLEHLGGHLDPRSEREAAGELSYDAGASDGSTIGGSINAADDRDANRSEDHPTMAPSFASPSPASNRQQLAIMMAKRLGEMHKRSNGRIAQLAALSGMEAEAIEAAALRCSPQDFDSTLIADEPALVQAWSAWMQEDRDNHRHARAAREARSNDRDCTTVAQFCRQPTGGLQVAAAMPGELVETGLESQSFVAGLVATPSTTDDDIPASAAVEKAETVASVSPAPVSSPTTQGGAVDERCRVIAADYYLWLRGRPDHLWSSDIAHLMAAAVGIDPITLDKESRQRCLDRYGHDKLQHVSRDQRIVLVVEVVEAARAAGFDELLAIREIVLAASRRAKKAAVDRPKHDRRKGGNGVGQV